MLLAKFINIKILVNITWLAPIFSSISSQLLRSIIMGTGQNICFNTKLSVSFSYTTLLYCAKFVAALVTVINCCCTVIASGALQDHN